MKFTPAGGYVCLKARVVEAGTIIGRDGGINATVNENFPISKSSSAKRSNDDRSVSQREHRIVLHMEISDTGIGVRSSTTTAFKRTITANVVDRLLVKNALNLYLLAPQSLITWMVSSHCRCSVLFHIFFVSSYPPLTKACLLACFQMEVNEGIFKPFSQHGDLEDAHGRLKKAGIGLAFSQMVRKKKSNTIVVI